MIAFFALLVVMFGILVFRIFRTVHYYREASNNPDPKERNIARTNFFIHIVVCAVLTLCIAMAVYWFLL